ncbi:MAG TPA: 50S ribosomal protein L37ae [Candidatus Poseidoniaceae archaeon]|nr:MAG TPA: 50S ribosomal protein L37ae [Candidatus Poseidoniales archaeon]HII12065.1 50S ribosomal protein L37ae [Candidatus Poseidoniaceae archaeon]
MAKRTQKAGATARFGARYGVSVRRNSGTALAKKNAKYTCPVCQYRKVTRKSRGIWSCGKCDHTFAGGAWEPFTRASDANNRILRRSVEGATTADMAYIAQQAAMDYERALAAGEITEEE